ncbi:MAG: hypothetical protein AAGJ50_05830, partial [Pseudomonadota bacterium]
PRWRGVLERCRTVPNMVGQAFDLEYNDETLSFSLAAGLAVGQATPRAVRPFEAELQQAV